MFKLFRKKNEEGFTIAELLIVIVVLGILAAIAIPSFTGLQKRARRAELESNGRAIVLALEMYKIETGKYPDVQTQENNINELKVPLQGYLTNVEQILQTVPSGTYKKDTPEGGYTLTLGDGDDTEVTFVNGVLQTESETESKPEP
ncbi:MAG TPA: prepilin-type N-terminal cleavage/methylation domain-containing protein [Firmicutes bacterium]|nr:prepilin-type N-terminal cleavage/methylation domain-containing protein [Bacillota bacterium]